MKKTAEAIAGGSSLAMPSRKKDFMYYVKRYWPYYLLVAIPMLHVFIFKYIPMYGVQLAFKDYKTILGVWGSPWVGWENFEDFFSLRLCGTYIMNTIYLSLYSMIAGFPFPIILALSLNYVKNVFFKKTVQMISYAPHFISMVVIVSILTQFLGRTGFVNSILRMNGMETILFMSSADLFADIYVWSGIWQGVGFGSIIYLGILTGVDYNLHEAAIVDGASVIKRMWYIDFPSILPTAITMLIMNTGNILNVGFEKALLMQNALNMSASEIISTYTYKQAFEVQLPNYGYSTAIGLFQSAIGFALIMIVNKIANKVSDMGVF